MRTWHICTSFEIAIALLDHIQSRKKPEQCPLLQKRQSNICLFKQPRHIVSDAHKTCWQNSWLLFFAIKHMNLNKQKWTSSSTLSRIFTFPVAGLSIGTFSAAWLLRSLTCTNLACTLYGETSLLWKDLQQTFANELKYQITVRRLQLVTHEVWQHWRSATKCHQTLSTAIGPGAFPGKLAKEAREHDVCDSMASSLRQRKRPRLVLHKSPKTSEKQLLEASEAAGRELWRRMPERP